MSKIYFFKQDKKNPFKGILVYESGAWIAHPPVRSFKKFESVKAKNISQVRDVFKYNKLIKVVQNGRQLFKR